MNTVRRERRHETKATDDKVGQQQPLVSKRFTWLAAYKGASLEIFRTMSERLLPIIDRERTELSIRLWNADKTARAKLSQRERKEAWRKLKNAARKFGLEVTIER